MLTLLVLLATQAGAATDTIAGTVAGPTGRPLAGAIVLATSMVTRASRSQTSDALGRFTVVFPERGARYQLTANYFGLVRARGVVWAREDRRPWSVRMVRAGVVKPIDTILSARDSLRLSPDQIRRLETIAAVGDSGALPVLESVRNLLTDAQWERLSTGPLHSVVIQAQASAALPPDSPPPPSASPPPPFTRPDLTLYTGVSTVYESNLIHAPAPLESYGVLLGLGAAYRRRWETSHTLLDVQYDGVFRRYSGTDIWNVPGHQADVLVTQRVARRWAVGGEGGMQLNGSAEDRVLRNEYTARANLDYRLRGTGRFQFYLEYMLKRYPDALISHNAADPRVGIKYRRAVGATGTWGIGGRYDYNQADTARHTYRGWTATTDFAFPVWEGGGISTYFRYNIRAYPSRLVRVGTVDVLRRDIDQVAQITWRQGIARVWDVVLSYRYEYYGSNDPNHTFRADVLAVALNRNW
jgi:carboxypeptidase family protein